MEIQSPAASGPAANPSTATDGVKLNVTSSGATPGATVLGTTVKLVISLSCTTKTLLLMATAVSLLDMTSKDRGPAVLKGAKPDVRVSDACVSEATAHVEDSATCTSVPKSLVVPTRPVQDVPEIMSIQVARCRQDARFPGHAFTEALYWNTRWFALSQTYAPLPDIAPPFLPWASGAEVLKANVSELAVEPEYSRVTPAAVCMVGVATIVTAATGS